MGRAYWAAEDVRMATMLPEPVRVGVDHAKPGSDEAAVTLVGDDVFIKGIRQGIDQGDYIYKSGELLRGKGDPHAEIKVDEQSFVYTITYAQDHGIWPRTPPVPPVSPAPASTGTGTGGPAPTPTVSPSPVPVPVAQETDVFEAEDVLKVALTRVFEHARRNGAVSFGAMTIRPFDKSDAMKLLALVKSVPNATKRIEIEAQFETPGKSEATISFKGDLDDATPLKDYLEPQFRAASDSDASVTYRLNFEPPLPVQGPGAEGLIQRLTRLVTPVAHILAVVAEKQS
jgi:hypothetical protein